MTEHGTGLGQLVAIGTDLYHRSEARVVDGAVVALEVILDDDLPVGGSVVLVPPIQAKLRDVYPDVCDELGQRRELIGERRRIEIRVDERHRTPCVHLHRRRPSSLASKPASPVRARHGAKSSVEVVGPGVIRALERSLVARAEADAGASVPADVDESLGAGCPRPGPARPNSPLLSGHEVTGFIGPFEVREVLPSGGKQAALLDRRYDRIAVPGPGNGPRGQGRRELNIGGGHGGISSRCSDPTT